MTTTNQPAVPELTQFERAGRAGALSIGLGLLGMHRQLTVAKHRRELADIDRRIVLVKEKLGSNRETAS